MKTLVPRHRTALVRGTLSRPLATAIADGLVTSDACVFDYGCGRGDDLEHLTELGIDNAGWDPAHRPLEPLRPADVVNLGYVLNVIEDVDERAAALRRAWELTQRVLVVSARMTWDARGLRGRPVGDGILTSTGTFQKFYSQDELRTLVDDCLGAPTLPAAPGIVYVFRNPADAHNLLASRVHRRTAPPEPWICEELFTQHQDLLTPLVEFLTRHGRLPRGRELSGVDGIVRKLGSLARAFAIISSVTGEGHWDEVRARSMGDLLVYLALVRFGGRPRFSYLPVSLQHDVREFVGSYKAGCTRADQLLLASNRRDLVDLAISSSPVGKRTPTALYVHEDAAHLLPPVLRVLEGCGQTLVGTVPGANVIKLHRAQPVVSYLSYPDFGHRPHPTLSTALTVDLRTRTIDLRDYRHSPDPPLLHRTEEFLSPDDPRRSSLSAITKAEIDAGLYRFPERIGTVNGWLQVCEECNWTANMDPIA
jgi:DNA phosphorothioation-associated putative methyltransferase